MNNLHVNLNQAANLIRNIGTTNTVLLEGQPGVGKSAVLKMLATELPDYMPCYIDCANLDLGDLGMPVIDREAMLTEYAPNARFGIGRNQNRPVVLMLDELGKALKPVLNMLLPVMLERRLMDIPLPLGSYVFATTNLKTDGVGDNIPAHVYNRLTVVDVANPESEAWLTWAANNDIAPEVMAFARDYPQVFERYDQMKDSKNPYIFNPMTGNVRAFCSPRSLEKASNIIKVRDAIGDAMLPALAGTVGESAARDLEANIALVDQLPRKEAVLSSPEKAKLPEGAGAYFLMAFRMAAWADDTNLDALMTYAKRWSSFEANTLFLSTLASNKAKVGMCCKHRAFTESIAKVGKYF